ncbi:uncharacterized protein LOC123194305 [Mangifera indica]|uniref:uncharacterized protein LOC123194305 n=1 Tax=Mangifera indica TaxID=29780 RepID=UPI001CFB7F83|nr:uncharacterized protein LOC123194305 [Mangifera indica]
MATNLLSFRPAGIQVCASSAPRKPDSSKPRSPSSNWWTPLFGWSSEPDYIDSNCKPNQSEADPEMKPTKASRFTPGCFTEEKAKQLRMMTKDTCFHDVMYHSAIASRLASDFKFQSESES